MTSGSLGNTTKLVSVYILSLVAILLWGMSYLWSDSLLSHGIPVEYIVFVRILIAGLVLLLLIWRSEMICGFTGKICRNSCCWRFLSRSYISYVRLMAYV